MFDEKRLISELITTGVKHVIHCVGDRPDVMAAEHDVDVSN